MSNPHHGNNGAQANKPDRFANRDQAGFHVEYPVKTPGGGYVMEKKDYPNK